VIILDDDEALDMIGTCGGAGFGASEPGAMVNYLTLVREGHNSVLGVPEKRTWIYAILPSGANPREVEQFIAASILKAVNEPHSDPAPLLLAVFQMEIMHIHKADVADEVQENRARLLRAQGQLAQHEKAAEVTRLYAVADDGRRWTGQHWLTGPRAGEMDGPTRVGPLDRVQLDDWVFARLLRHVIGLHW